MSIYSDVAKKRKTDRIPLNTNARAILNNTPKFFGSRYVFHNGKGEKRVDVSYFLRRVREKTGLPKDFRMLHGLRHTFASWLASSGEVDLYTLQKLLTHESPQMTQRYAHLTDDAMQKASNVIDDCLKIAINGNDDEIANTGNGGKSLWNNGRGENAEGTDKTENKDGEKKTNILQFRRE